MSRIGKNPIAIPDKVKVIVAAGEVKVEGPLGKLSETIHPLVKVEQKENAVLVTRGADDKLSRALHGTTRALISNMIVGVTKGFEKELEIIGVGYRAEQKGKDLNLLLGFSHPIIFKAPEGVTLTADGQTKIKVKGISKQMVGQAAAEIREYRKPEPYKGKGVRYTGETVRRKQGKKTGK